jgi:sulfopyruvate decarboxylase alpha subunit
MAETAGWQDELYDLLKNECKVSMFSYVPDAGHKVMINRAIADPDVQAVSLTTEEEGVALQAGAHLGGKRSVLLMQSSGVGNCVNFFALINNARFPFLTVISMRGDFGEGNQGQIPMGRATPKVLEAMDFVVLPIDNEADVIKTARAGAIMAFNGEKAVALLLSQKLKGAKAFPSGDGE